MTGNNVLHDDVHRAILDPAGSWFCFLDNTTCLMITWLSKDDRSSDGIADVYQLTIYVCHH